MYRANKNIMACLILDRMEETVSNRVYAGYLAGLPPPTPRTVRVYTSSTFTDMSLEKSVLVNEMYPQLKNYCKYVTDFLLGFHIII